MAIRQQLVVRALHPSGEFTATFSLVLEQASREFQPMHAHSGEGTAARDNARRMKTAFWMKVIAGKFSNIPYILF